MRRSLVAVVFLTGCGGFLGFSGEDEPPANPPAAPPPSEAGAIESGADAADSPSGDGGVPVGEAGGVIDAATTTATWICTVGGNASGTYDSFNECKIQQNVGGCGVTPGAACIIGEPDRWSCTPCAGSNTLYNFTYDECSCKSQ